MPVLVKPSVRTVDAKNNRHAISFTFSFIGETPDKISIGGVSYVGFMYEVSPIGLSSASLPPFKSLRFSQSFFSPTTNGDNDGDLFIYSPSSGEITRIGYPLNVTSGPDPADFLSAYGNTSGVIPVVCANDASLQFIKIVKAAVGVSGTIMEGILNATIYDFDVAPFITQGYDYQM